MSSAEFEAAVNSKVLPEHQPVMAILRQLMREYAPEAAEVISYGSPAWKGNKIIALVSPSKTHLTFAFERGAEFNDPYGLLDGTGKKTRHVKLKKVDDISREALSDYIRQGVALDKAG